MRRLGVITDIAYSGLLLVRADFAPKIGEKVLDSRKKKMGTVIRVFGPTKAPFVTVKPSERKTSLSLVGQELFLR
ncbi:MAG: H/ACA ribonucleoprotein complex subunit GAR1 [Thermoplasmata archaeon]